MITEESTKRYLEASYNKIIRAMHAYGVANLMDFDNEEVQNNLSTMGALATSLKKFINGTSTAQEGA